MELFEQKGVVSKDGIITLAEEIEAKDSLSRIPQRFNVQDNAVIEQVITVILQHGLSADQGTVPLGRTIQLLEWGKQASHETGVS